MRLLFQYRKKWVLLLPLLLLSLTWVGVSSITAQDSLEACAFTTEMAEGQGFNVQGLGFNVQGLGFNVAGLGFNVAGLGFNVQGLGITTEDVAIELFDGSNVVHDATGVTPADVWLPDRLADIEGGVGFAETPTAILVVDDFAGEPLAEGAFSLEDPHGKKVSDVLKSFLTVLRVTYPDLPVTIVPVDISDSTTNYRVDQIVPKLRSTINGLIEDGYKHFVINMSFGILPCDTVASVGEQTVHFNFNDAVEAVNEANTFQEVDNILECVSKNGDGTYTAHFGYENPNGMPVIVPPGEDNYLTGGGLPENLLTIQTPFYFGRPNVVEGRPGRSDFYPNSAFQVVFDGSNLVWNLYGHTETANKYSTRCYPAPTIYPSQHHDDDDHHDSGSVYGGDNQLITMGDNYGGGGDYWVPQVTNILECVADNGDGTLTAHFGFQNLEEVPLLIRNHYKNNLTGGGLSEYELIVATPAYFGTPNVVQDQPGRSALFPNSAFQITFDANYPLTWTLLGNSITASSESPACITSEGYGFSNYFIENLGLDGEQVNDLYTNLLNQVAEDDATLAALEAELQYWLGQNQTSDDIRVIPVASAGNSRYYYPRTDPTNFNEPLPFAPPFYPASLSETIAVSALLGNLTEPLDTVSPDNRGSLWRFSQDGNVAVPGGTIKVGDNLIYVGTSFAAPYVSMISALWLTYADACTYANADMPPLNLDVAADFVNGFFSDPASAYPLTCEIPIEEEAQKIEIDIRPESHRNIINLNSAGKFQVAIFSDESFNALDIDLRSVTLAGASVVTYPNGFPIIHVRDVNHDHKKDLIVYFNIQDLDVSAEDTEATLTGELYDGGAFFGTDSVEIIPLQAPRLYFPSDGAKLWSHFVWLKWSPVTASSCYLVQVNDTPFTSDDQTDVLWDATVVSYPGIVTPYLGSGTYYWRVQVGGSCNIPPGPWSESRSFQVR
ncbi:MAG: hypothetical protein H6672_03970 [Anaerolineaceae bacterium]|nr:hypothetical protein [Anaerolineaceae bacterium]